jgi:hypothetical protein
LEPFTTGSLPASQFNASQLPFVDFGDVPIADSHDFEDRSLVVVVRNAKAVTQIAVSFSWTWPTLEQRNRSVTASQESLSGSPERSLPVLVQFGHSSDPGTRNRPLN